MVPEPVAQAQVKNLTALPRFDRIARGVSVAVVGIGPVLAGDRRGGVVVVPPTVVVV